MFTTIEDAPFYSDLQRLLARSRELHRRSIAANKKATEVGNNLSCLIRECKMLDEDIEWMRRRAAELREASLSICPQAGEEIADT